MALTRKFLSALGIEQDKIDEIITAHVETVDHLKSERDGYKKDAEKLTDVQKELDTLKNTGNNDEALKKQYDDLKADYEKYKAEQEEAKSAREKAETYKAVLREAGVSEKRIETVLKVTDLKSIEFDDKGNVKDVDKVKENIKKEWEDFIEKKEDKGADTTKPPANTGGKTMTRKDIMAIRDTEERQKAIEENHELFGF